MFSKIISVFIAVIIGMIVMEELKPQMRKIITQRFKATGKISAVDWILFPVHCTKVRYGTYATKR